MGWRVDNELQVMLRDSAQAHLSDKGGSQHFRAVRDGDAGFDAGAWAGMGEMGWTGMLLPEELGGSELGLEPALTLAEELGRTVAPEPFVSAAVIAATVLAASSADPARQLTRSLAEGTRSVTLAWQEERGAIGMPQFRTYLSGGRLNGTKVHVPAWHDDTALLVAAQGEDGDVVLAVDPSAEGVSVVPKRLTDASFCADIRFDNAAISDSAILLSATEAAAALDLALARGTVALSAQLEGLASALWQMTAQYMQQRVQFGTALSDFQALRHQMVDLYAQIELASASWRSAAEALDSAEIRGVAVHAAKARCSQIAQDMGRWAIQYHGAFGYTDEADIGLYVHAALCWSMWLGNPVAHRRAALGVHRAGKVSHG